MEPIQRSQKNKNEIYFDTYEIDNKLSKKDICEIKIKKNEEIINNIFKHFKKTAKEEPNSEDKNIDFPKYFAQIGIDEYKYTGILSNNLNRDMYGYSLMPNNDQYLGEYKKEIRDGFGIYKFNPNENEIEIYIGNYINNKKTGKGMYLKIFQLKDNTLINYECSVGDFENDIFKKGIIFSMKNEEKTLYKGKVDENGIPDDDNAIIIKNRNNVLCGKIVNGEFVEGRNIILNNNNEKEKGYYFCVNNMYNMPYKFDYRKNEENDESLIKILKNHLNKDYNNKIQNIYNKIINILEQFNDFEKAISFNFNGFKSEIQSNIDNIIKE